MEAAKFSQIFTIITIVILFIILCIFIYLSYYFSQRVDETKQVDIGKIKHLNTLMWICIFCCIILAGLIVYAGMNYFISSKYKEVIMLKESHIIENPRSIAVTEPSVNVFVDNKPKGVNRSVRSAITGINEPQGSSFSSFDDQPFTGLNEPTGKYTTRKVTFSDNSSAFPVG
jgi:hypothetical protein